MAGGDGFDKLAAYGFDDLIGKFRWLIDTNNDGIIDPAAGDHATIQPAGYQINGLPVAGDFDGNPNNGDEIGLFDGTKWYFDTNHNWVIDSGDTVSTTSLRGTPIVGDFNGDGVLDLATWRNDQFTFNFGTQPGGAGTQPQWSGAIDATINWGLPGTAEKPVAADMDQDGITDIGLFLPARTGTLPLESGNWEFLLSNDFGEDFRGGKQVTALNHPFSPVPLGNDLFAQFGDGFALPIVGNFDPPVAQPQLPTAQTMPDVLGTLPMGSHTINGEEWYSFTPLRSGTIVVDAATSTPNSQLTAYLYTDDYHLLGSSSATAIAHVSLRSSVVGGETYLLRLSGDDATANITLTNQVPDYDRLDTSRDGIISPNDALRIINYLLESGTGITTQATTDSKLYLDTNLDGRISPNDVLQVINYLLDHPNGVVPTTAGGSGVQPLVSPAGVDLGQQAASPAATTPAGSASVAFALSLSASISPATSLVPSATDSIYASWPAEDDAPAAAADESSVSLALVAGDEPISDDAADNDPLAGDADADWWN